ncbi:MAG: CCA tRNA nucleotidyltransferase [Defluviitaleaceae bacterium]|nr:CCA tRNA nucleotidyltransferase [Defluviitaleaceae bacterium]
MSIKSSGQKVLKQLKCAGYEAYFVGGMVRDRLLGHELIDVDITTEATPDQVLTLFEKVIPTGLKHGTVTVVIEGHPIEVTTFRLDGDYVDHRHPEGVAFTGSLMADLKRRDFTINAMAQGLDDALIDPFNGQIDLEGAIIRAVGNPLVRFEEDALRILRGMRFVAKLGFDLEEETLKAMQAHSGLLGQLSLERIRKEFEGIIGGEYRQKALKIMRDGGLFDHIPFFDVFARCCDKEIERLDDFKLMLLLTEASCQDSVAFLTQYPLTRDEKKLIKDVHLARSKWNDLDKACERLIQYYFGVETLRLKKKYQHFFDAKNKETSEAFKAFRLPIESRSDLAIEPKEVIAWSNDVPGAWINQLFTEIEVEVVLGRVENNRKSLLAFIQERGVFDVEEN